jgi:hypothetical protein
VLASDVADDRVAEESRAAGAALDDGETAR